MANETLQLTPQLRDYMLRVSLRETAAQRRLREETLQHPLARMQIASEQGQFMALLARMAGARRALEIGVFTGYSTLCVAQALPRDGRIVACDVNAEFTAIAQRHWAEAGVAHKIDLRIAPARDTLDELLRAGQAGTHDFAFIDADKINYDAYYERCLRLLRPGGLIVLDNVLWGGDVADPAVNDESTRALRNLNEKLHRDERIDLSLLPIGDGVTLALKR